MLMKMAVLQRIRTGDISVVFRRWRRPTVKTGGTLQTAVGLLNIVNVEDMADSDVTETDVGRAGCDTETARLGELGTRGTRGDRLSRVTVTYGGADPRIALRETDALSGTELDALATRLQRLDARSASGPSTPPCRSVTWSGPSVTPRPGQERRRGSSRARCTQLTLN